MRRILTTTVAILAYALPVRAQLPGLDDTAAKAAKVTALIDRHLDKSWAANGVKPALVADDAEFLRRLSLDVIGRTPRVAEVRAFLAEPSPTKRTDAAARLVQMPAHAAHFARTTRAEWLPGSFNGFDGRQANVFQTWLQDQFARNTPADELARTLITANVRLGQRGRVATESDAETDQIANFYQANEGKPETIASALSRTLMGVTIECAQCHDHPFAPYSRDQFWRFAAFFGEFTPLPPTSPSFVGPLPPQSELNQLAIPNTTETATAAFFDGTAPSWSVDRTPRAELAAWVTGPANPYFARNAANRLWAHFFGLGLIDPVDEPGPENPASHPELLRGLAAAYAECGYDTRVMVRGIVGSRAYGLTSRMTDPSQASLRQHARMPVRGLTGPQLFASFQAATGLHDATSDNDYFSQEYRANRGAFNALFGQGINRPTETQTSMLQALMLMNGPAVAKQTDLKTGETLGAIIDAPFMTNAQRVETLYLAALGRTPTADERERHASELDRAKPAAKNQALADLFWVLLNSPEFVFNH